MRIGLIILFIVQTDVPLTRHLHVLMQHLFIMSNFHTFGCLCYVLDHRLQSGTGKIPKWEPCVWMMGIHVR